MQLTALALQIQTSWFAPLTLTSLALSLPFPLLADEGHKVCEQYGVWGAKNLMGRAYEGVMRTTFLIDWNGKIALVFEKIKLAGRFLKISKTYRG